MSDKKNHNSIYFLTTLSVYLGLVIVGASPQILAQVENSRNIQTSRFELSSRTSDVLADLEKRSGFERQNVLPFTFFGGSASPQITWKTQAFGGQTVEPSRETFAENDQIFVISNLPRASL
jgi:hypothetical protein